MLLRAGVEVPDFRLSTRTFYINDPKRSALNPLSWPFRLVRFWYWHMNFHIEHHMYAAVPCYNLEKLHNVRPSSDTLLTRCSCADDLTGLRCAPKVCWLCSRATTVVLAKRS